MLWWVGETQASVQHHERAYAAFRHRDDLPNAAMGAVGLYLTYRASLGRTAVARGWLARAARMVEEAGLAPLAGWVALLRAHDSADAIAAERWATEAREAAGRYGDADLELCALSQLGAASAARYGRALNRRASTDAQARRGPSATSPQIGEASEAPRMRWCDPTTRLALHHSQSVSRAQQTKVLLPLAGSRTQSPS